MDRLTLIGIAAVAAGAVVVYAVFRAGTATVVQTIKEEAKVEATNELLSGAAEVAAAANETLAAASDPGALPDDLAAGKL